MRVKINVNSRQLIVKRQVFKLMMEKIISLKKKQKNESKRDRNIQRMKKKSKRKREKLLKFLKYPLSNGLHHIFNLKIGTIWLLVKTK